MADRLIYADLLRKDLDKTIEHIAKKQGGTEEGSFAVGMCLAFKTMINEQPTIEAKPIVHAHWFMTEYEYFGCSNCGIDIWNGCDSTAQAKQMLANKEVMYKYCPYCGAQMDEKESD